MWNYEMLSTVEQTALRRLAVFAGTFDMRSAGAVIADDELFIGAVSAAVGSLAAKSLLITRFAGQRTMYRLCAEARDCALPKLEASAEWNAIKRRHAHLCLRWAEGSSQGESGERIDDVRSAIDWCLSPQGDASLGVSLTAVSAPLWFQSAFLSDYRSRLEQALRALQGAPNPDHALELRLNAALGDAITYTTGAEPRATAAFNRTLELAEQIGTDAYQRRAIVGLWVGRMGAADYQTALGFAEAYSICVESSSNPAAVLTGHRMMALAHHLSGNQITARHHAERALTEPSGQAMHPADCACQFDHRVAVLAGLARILWIQGYPDQAMRAARESLERARATGDTLSLCHALRCVASVVLWRGDVVEARRLTALLIDLSVRHSLPYWEFWARCLELALARRDGEMRTDDWVLRDPLCSPTHQESLATLDAGLATREVLARAEGGLAGWCAAELLRIQAEAILKANDGNPARAEALLHRSMEIAREQGALSWELRTATTLARHLHAQRRSRQAHDLLSGVQRRFVEGQTTCDLRKARVLLEDIQRSSPPFAVRERFITLIEVTEP